MERVRTVLMLRRSRSVAGIGAVEDRLCMTGVKIVRTGGLR
jgi:hypothetical protein